MPLPWGNPLAIEPIDRYRDTEKQRTEFLVGSMVERARTKALERVKALPPPAPKKKKSFLDRSISAIDTVTPEFSETAGKGVLKGLDAGGKYAGAPLLAVTSGRIGAEQQVNPATGETYRDFDPSWGDGVKGIKKIATQSPVKSYKEARQADEEANRDPAMPKSLKVAESILTDPLSYIGPGLVKGALTKAPAAVRASKGARFAGAILENPARTSAGGLVGAVGATEVAERTNAPGPIKAIAPLVGGVLGGVAATPGNLGRAGRAIDAASDVESRLTRAVPGPGGDMSPELGSVGKPPSLPTLAPLRTFGLDALGKPLPRKPAKPMTMEPTREDLMKWLIADGTTTPKDAGFLTSAGEIDATRDAYFRDALSQNKASREAGDLKTPYRENVERVGVDAESIARGRKALLARVSSEASKKEITPDMAESARWFIKELPDKYLGRLGSSYVKRGDGVAGQYVAQDIDAEDGIIRIVKGIALKQPEPERVIVHEIGHHLEQFVDDADYTALRSQWQREMGSPGIFPGSGEGGQALVDSVDDLHRSVNEARLKNADNPNWKEKPAEDVITGDTYRYQGGFGEWFAENIADRALRDFQGSTIDNGPWKRAWESIKDVAATAYRYLMRRGEKDAAERVYRKILNGEYEGSTRGDRLQSSIQNMEDQARPTPKWLEDADQGEVTDPEWDAWQAREDAKRAAQKQPRIQQVKPLPSPNAALTASIPDRIQQAPAADVTPSSLAPTPKGTMPDRFAEPGGTEYTRQPDGTWQEYPNEGFPRIVDEAQAQAAWARPTTVPFDVQPAAVAGNPGPTTSAGQGVAGGGPPPSQPPATLPPSRPGKKPATDMLNTIGRAERLAEEARHHKTLRGRIETGVRTGVNKVGGSRFDKNLVQDDPVTVFTVKVKNDLDNITQSWEGYADDLFAEMDTALRGSYTQATDGTRTMPNGANFSDMFERRTPEGIAAYAALRPEQQAAIEKMRDFGEQLNENLRYHSQSGTLGWDQSVEEYFPRVSVGRDGKPWAHIGDNNRTVGGKKSFMKERTQATFDEGLKDGVNYADERIAWKMMTRAKLRAASDDYITKNLKPLGKTETQIPKGDIIGRDWVALPQGVAPALNGRYFEPEVAQRIASALTPKPNNVIEFVTGANRILTPLRATGDISWLFQQGLPMVFRHPGLAAKGAGKVLWSATFGDRENYDQLIKSVKFDKEDAIKHGLHWTGADLPAADHGIVKIPSKFTKIPVAGEVVKGANKAADFSNETFGRYMNYTRAVFAADAQKRLKSMQKSMSPEEYRLEYKKAMSAVNRMSGNTGRKVTSAEAMFAFAPRYFSASVEQLATAVSKRGLEGSLARQHIGSMLVVGGTAVFLANSQRGFDTNLDPRDSNFLRFRDIGGLDVSPFGTYDTLFRAIAGTAAGDEEGAGPDITKLWKLAEGKMSPGLKLLYEPLIKKSTYSGEKLDPTSLEGWGDIAVNTAVSSAPFSVQNLINEGIKPSVEEKSAKPLLDSLPGLVASATGTTNSPVTPIEQRNWARDEVAEDLFGMKYDDLPKGSQKAAVNQDEKVAKWQGEADKNTLTRTDDQSINQRASIEQRSAVEALTARFASGEIRGNEFRQNSRQLQARQWGAREVLPQFKGDPELEGYFSLFDAATRKDKSMDYDKLEPMLAAYEAQHPDILDKVDAITGTMDNEVMVEFRAARKEAQEYHSLPMYQGMTTEEADIAKPILDITRSMVSNKRAVDYKQALRQLIELDYITEEQARLAIRATRAGTSQERKEYKVTHPLYAKYYNDDISEINGMALPELGAFPERRSAARRTSKIGVRDVRRSVGRKVGAA